MMVLRRAGDLWDASAARVFCDGGACLARGRTAPAEPHGDASRAARRLTGSFAPAFRTRWFVSVCLVLAFMVSRAPAQTCAGDCDGNGHVTVNELVTAVSITLGNAGVDLCPVADRDGNERVTVDEVVAAVGSALSDCSSHPRAFVVTTNFIAGSFATIELEEPHEISPSTPQRRIHSDATARMRGDLVYVVNRLFADNIQVLDSKADFATRLQCSVGNGTNPHDIAFASNAKAYVTRFEKSELLIVNPAAQPDCSDFIRGTIDLSGLADADGIPDMDLMVVVGDRLYVALQRLDINTLLRLPAANGAIAVIDTNTDRVVDTIELTGENPFSATKGLTVRDDLLWVAEAGRFGVMDGGIERIDLATNRGEGGFYVTEEDLGGDIVDFVLVDDHLAYAIVSRDDFSTTLVAFDPTTATIIDTLVSVDGFTLLDIELDDRGEIYLTDRDRQHDGMRIFNARERVEITTQPLDVGLPPFEVVFLP